MFSIFLHVAGIAIVLFTIYIKHIFIVEKAVVDVDVHRIFLHEKKVMLYRSKTMLSISYGTTTQYYPPKFDAMIIRHGARWGVKVTDVG